MISSKPKFLDPQGKLFSVFNVSNFYSNNDLVTESRLMEYSNMYSKNIFYYLNSFLNGLLDIDVVVKRSPCFNNSACKIFIIPYILTR